MATSRAAAAQPTDLPDPSDLIPSDPPSPNGPLTFRQPETDPASESPWLQDSDSPSGSAEPSEPLDDLSDAPHRSSRTSSAENPMSKAAMRDAARQGVKIAGTTAHELLVHDEAGAAVGLYLADDDDAEAIGDPLANIAYRRGGLGAVANPDLADALAAMVGLALYAMKQLQRRRLAKQLRNRPSTAPAETLSDLPAGDRPGTGAQAAYGPGNG
jgi:hypothetical protein